MATVIAATVGTSMTYATGRPTQSHLVYGAGSARWFLFYLSGTQALGVRVSADFASWSDLNNAGGGTTLTLAHPHGSRGRNFGFAYKSIASTDVVHMAAAYTVGSALDPTHTRFVMSTATFDNTANTEVASDSSAASSNTLAGVSPCIRSDNKIVDFNSFLSYNGGSPMVITSTNADLGTSWTAGFGSSTQIGGAPAYFCKRLDIMPIGATAICSWENMSTNTTATNIQYNNFVAAGEHSVLAAPVTATVANNYDVLRIDDTHYHAVMLSNNSNTYVHNTYNGTTWASNAGSPAVPPNLTLATESGLFLTTDGTDVWLFAIDSSNNIQVAKWTAATAAWDAAWTLVDAGAVARSSLTGVKNAVGTKIGLVWTQANASNYDIVGTTYTTVAAPPPSRFGHQSLSGAGYEDPLE